jgi:hypothetical protein
MRDPRAGRMCTYAVWCLSRCWTEPHERCATADTKVVPRLGHASSRARRGEWLRLAVLRIEDGKAMQDAAVRRCHARGPVPQALRVLARISSQHGRHLDRRTGGSFARVFSGGAAGVDPTPFDPRKRRAIDSSRTLPCKGDKRPRDARWAGRRPAEGGSGRLRTESNHDKVNGARRGQLPARDSCNAALAEPARDDFAFLARLPSSCGPAWVGRCPSGSLCFSDSLSRRDIRAWSTRLTTRCRQGEEGVTGLLLSLRFPN